MAVWTKYAFCFGVLNVYLCSGSLQGEYHLACYWYQPGTMAILTYNFAPIISLKPTVTIPLLVAISVTTSDAPHNHPES